MFQLHFPRKYLALPIISPQKRGGYPWIGEIIKVMHLCKLWRGGGWILQRRASASLYINIITFALLWSDYGCLNHDLSKRGLIYAVGFNIRQGRYHCKFFLLIFTLKGWSHLSFTKVIDSFWIYIQNPSMYSSISISSNLSAKQH